MPFLRAPLASPALTNSDLIERDPRSASDSRGRRRLRHAPRMAPPPLTTEACFILCREVLPPTSVNNPM